jgi:cellulose synthase/poly-beta-1,6-N-acetylglucosamine synthase-like glycosyltransferase
MSVFESVIFWLYLACAVSIIFFLLYFVRRINKCKELPFSKSSVPVSVIVCAYNEALNLKKNLPFILEQDYPSYEVILVNDRSTDATRDVILNFMKEYSNLKLVDISEDEKKGLGKKYPLSKGIAAAKNEHLLMTDADCRPQSKDWISHMMSGFTPGKEIVLGFGKYEKRAGWVNKLVQFDTFFVAIQYFSFALAGLPYMGVGRNIAYSKSLFESQGGFSSHQEIASGDDDLFVMQAATKENTSVMMHQDSHTISVGKENFDQYWFQKTRHLSTGKWYKGKLLFHLSVISTSFLAFPLLLWLNLLLNNMVLVVLAVWLLKLILHYYIFKSALQKLASGVNLILSLIFGNILMILNQAVAYRNLIIKKDKW